jgi:hypothetical protein
VIEANIARDPLYSINFVNFYSLFSTLRNCDKNHREGKKKKTSEFKEKFSSAILL